MQFLDKHFAAGQLQISHAMPLSDILDSSDPLKVAFYMHNLPVNTAAGCIGNAHALSKAMPMPMSSPSNAEIVLGPAVMATPLHAHAPDSSSSGNSYIDDDNWFCGNCGDGPLGPSTPACPSCSIGRR